MVSGANDATEMRHNWCSGVTRNSHAWKRESTRAMIPKGTFLKGLSANKVRKTATTSVCNFEVENVQLEGAFDFKLRLLTR